MVLGAEVGVGLLADVWGGAVGRGRGGRVGTSGELAADETPRLQGIKDNPALGVHDVRYPRELGELEHSWTPVALTACAGAPRP